MPRPIWVFTSTTGFIHVEIGKQDIKELDNFGLADMSDRP
jgi:hypothetical protein